MLSLLAFSAIAMVPKSVPLNIDQLISKEVDSGTLIGVYVCRENGEALYSHMSHARLIPASNQKVLSAVLAFDMLGPDFRFKTNFWKDGDNVWIEAPGDLTITPQQLYQIKEKLQVSGRGKVYVKQSYRFEYGPSWETDDRPFRYAPSTTALCVNRAQFTVILQNGIPTVPFWTGVKVRHISSVFPAQTSYDREKELVTIRGKIDPKANTLATFALADPDRAAARIFGTTFITTQNAPKRQPDFVLESEPLREYAKFCLEPSDNLLAESLLLNGTQESDYGKATRKMRDVLAKNASLPIESIRPDDGSGMSRHNLVTPFALAQVLRHALQQPYRDDFVRAMPSGGEGTLGSRFAKLNVTAKTGSLDTVSCLSGYVWLPNGEPVIFSIMMNHFTQPTSEMRKLQDSIVQYIYDSLK